MGATSKARTDEYAFILLYSIAKGIAIENNTTTVVIPLLFLLRKIPKQKKNQGGKFRIGNMKRKSKYELCSSRRQSARASVREPTLVWVGNKLRALLVSTPVGSSLGERAPEGWVSGRETRPLFFVLFNFWLGKVVEPKYY